MESVHPSEQELSAYGLGKLDDARAAKVGRHLGGCPSCRRRVAEAAPDSFLDRLRDARAGSPVGATVGTARTGSDRTADADPSLASIPRELAEHPDYEIIRELGRGGMGVVYLAHNRLMGRDEVLKVMGPQFVERPGAYDRFQREIRAVASLRHPNIVAAYTAFRAGGGLVLAMEFVDGMDLSRHIKVKGPLPVLHAAYFTHQAALGLQHAHERGMVHRDIKPHNLMLSVEGKFRVIKILDFGLAKATREGNLDGGLTREGQALGTAEYVAPEQIVNAADVDVRADIYSLGCSLYFLLAGRPPFQGNSLYDLFQAHLSRDAGPLDQLRSDVPSELSALVAKMMAKDPDTRFQTPADVAQALTPFFKKSSKGGTRPAPPPVSPMRDSEGSAEPHSSRPADVPRAPASPEIMWASLIDFRETMVESPGQEPGRAPMPDPLAAAETPRRGRIPLRGVVAVAAVLLAFGLSWLAWQLLVRTPYGTIRFDNLPADAVVTVDGQEIKVAWTQGDPGEIIVAAGPRGLEVHQGQVKIHGETVTVEAGKTFAVHLDKIASATTEARSIQPPGELPTSESVTPIVAEDVPDGFTPLFKGRDLTGWQTHFRQPGDWRIEAGVLIGEADGISHLYSERGDYKDFHLIVEARINERGNSGVFVRSTNAPVQPLSTPRWPDGYEAQINSKGTESNRTGSLYTRGRAFVNSPQEPPAPDEWFTMEVIAEGNHIRVLVNGLLITDFVDDQRMARSGHIALQVHDWQSRVEFRKIAIKELVPPAEEAMVPTPWADGFERIFNGRDLTGWRVDRGEPARWRAQEGNLIWNGSSDYRNQSFLLTDRDYKDFVLRFEFQMEKGSDGGVVFRAEPGELPSPPEINLRNFDEPPGVHAATAALRWSTDGRAASYLAPSVEPQLRPGGDWSTMEVDLRGDTLKIKVNDAIVQALDLSAAVASRRDVLKGFARKSGRVGFQCHSGTGRIRNVEVRELDLAAAAPPAGPWPADAKEFRGAHYKLFRRVLAWPEAVEECRKLGGRLVIVRDEATNNFLLAYMKEFGLPETWLGASDVEVEGDWKWVDGSRMTFNLWTPGQPSNTTGGPSGEPENYLTLTAIEGDFREARWNDVTAHGWRGGPQGFICEWPATVPELHPWPTDAKEFRGGHYKLFPQKWSWHQAVDACRKMGGRLVVVHDAAEDAFVRSLLKQQNVEATWIGASDEKVEGKWVWLDGSPMTYANWSDGQPNNKGDGEHYAVLIDTFQGMDFGGRWSDQPNVSKEISVGFVCQWPAPAPAKRPKPR